MGREDAEMTAAQIVRSHPQEPVHTTLLAFVTQLEQVADGDDDVVEAARTLIRDERVVLTGNFRGCSLD